MVTREALLPKDKLQEMDEKRWLVRYLILAALGTILAFKVYVTLFVIDMTVGAYSIATGSVIFGYFLLSYAKFKDPYLETKNLSLSNRKPLVSIIVAVKNEERFIRNCIQACINSTYPNKEIIVIDDGSTDKTPQILDEISLEADIHIIHTSKSRGKKSGIEMGIDMAFGEIYVFTDSDCNMAPDAIEKAVEIFMSDNRIGAITGHGRIRDASSGNTLEKLQDVWYDGQYRIYKGAESSFSTLSCCSGPFTAYRKEAVRPHIHSWVHDKFLGKEFKFATDRRLTAFVLGAHKTRENLDGHGYAWKMKYSPSIRVFIGTPKNIHALLKQQIRWRKSFIRSIFSTGGVFWRRPFPIALLYYLQLCLKMVRPYIVLKSVVLLPIMGDYFTCVLYFSSVFFTSMIYAVDFRLRNPGNGIWLYRLIMTMFSTFVFIWLIIYSLITIRNPTWR